jgi:soluble lytic murein transglycosylase
MTTRAILRTGGATLAAALWIAGSPAVPQAGQGTQTAPPELWLAPPGNPPAGALPPFAVAIASLNAGKAAAAEPVFARMTKDPVLGGYGLLYLGRAQLVDDKPSAASFSAQELLKHAPAGHLFEAALWLAANAAEAAHDSAAQVRALQTLTTLSTSEPELAWLGLARAQVAAGDRQAAMQSYARVYYEFALTDSASTAGEEMAKIAAGPIVPTKDSYALDLGRAQQLYGARRFTDAHKAFDALRPLAAGDDRSLISLRLAECDFGLRRYPAARDALRAYLDQAALRVPEAQYFYLGAIRETGRADDYIAEAHAFVDRGVDPALAEETLNDLGSYFIRQDDDATAASVFAEMARRFPQGVHADRATWKTGWWAYRNGDYTATINLFQNAAVILRKSDYRPAWLYWTAKAQSTLGDRTAARDTYRQVVSDYRNSYYGREAARAIEQLRPVPTGAAVRPAAPARRDVLPPINTGQAPPNATLVRALLSAGLYDDAILELRTAQRESGTSPIIEATIAYALNRRGDLRPGITAMRRAYPQFIAEGGEALPSSILTVIFPIDYWNLIYKYATARSLDPYLMAALIAQESTFDPKVKSGANAWGLMQVLPSTGRQYAARLGIRPFHTGRLTEPETNIRIGMAFFADLVRQFGNVAPALAAYNAGEDRASKWLAERPGLGRDEFIDDIPYPETQNYVKRIIGQAEDYRLLYRRPGPDTAPTHTGAGADQEP